MQGYRVYPSPVGYDARYIWPQPSQISCFSASDSLNRKAPLLWVVDLLVTRQLKPGTTRGVNHMFLILHLGADGPNDLVKSHALGISSGTHIPASSLALRSDTCTHSRKLFKVVLPHRTSSSLCSQEAALCSHCILDPGEEGNPIGLTAHSLPLFCFGAATDHKYCTDWTLSSYWCPVRPGPVRFVLTLHTSERIPLVNWS